MKTTTNKGEMVSALRRPPILRCCSRDINKETNMKTTIKLIGIITIVIMAFAIAGCKDETPEQPVAKSHEIKCKDNTNKDITVTVNYNGLPSAGLPDYMTPLTTVVTTFVAAGSVNGDLIINVIPGDSSFTKTASKTLSVGEDWLSGKTEDQIGPAVGPLFNQWIA